MEEIVCMTMGEYIKQLRLSKGWSQEELGKFIGVNRAAVNKWELGTVENIKRSTIKKLSQVFEVSPCELMQWEEDRKPGWNTFNQTTTETQLLNQIEQFYNPLTSKLVSKFSILDNIDQAKVVERTETLLENEKYLKKGKSLNGEAM